MSLVFHNIFVGCHPGFWLKREVQFPALAACRLLLGQDTDGPPISVSVDMWMGKEILWGAVARRHCITPDEYVSLCHQCMNVHVSVTNAVVCFKLSEDFISWCFSTNSNTLLLTATVLSITVQSVVGGTATLGTSRCGEAKVGTVAVVMWAIVGTLLTGGMEHQDVQHQLQLALKTRWRISGRIKWILNIMMVITLKLPNKFLWKNKEHD